MIEPKAFLEFAENLFNKLPNNNDSIEVRNCISRAYYYIFHLGREKFRNDKRAKFGTYDIAYDHKLLINFFDDIKMKEVASRISKFRNDRNRADYELNIDLNKSAAEESIKLAKGLEYRINNISVKTN